MKLTNREFTLASLKTFAVMASTSTLAQLLGCSSGSSSSSSDAPQNETTVTEPASQSVLLPPSARELRVLIEEIGHQVYMPSDGIIDQKNLLEKFARYQKPGPQLDPTIADAVNEVHERIYNESIPQETKIIFASPQEFEKYSGKRLAGTTVGPHIAMSDDLVAASQFGVFAHELGHVKEHAGDSQNNKGEYAAMVTDLRMSLGLYTLFPEVGNFSKELTDAQIWNTGSNPLMSELYSYIDRLDKDEDSAYTSAAKVTLLKLEQGMTTGAIEDYIKGSSLSNLYTEILGELSGLSHERKRELATNAITGIYEREIATSELASHTKGYISSELRRYVDSVFPAEGSTRSTAKSIQPPIEHILD